MTTSTLYHTQGIRGCDYKKDSAQGKYGVLLCLRYCQAVELPMLRLQADSDPSNQSVSSDPRATHWFKKTLICVQVRRIRCKHCGSCARERLDFCSGPNVTYTKWLAKFVLALRAQMSISAVAELTGLHWDTVKNIEKVYLARKYAKVSLRSVRRLAVCRT